MSKLRILIISDGRAGHFHLSEGIAAALGRKQDVDTEYLQINCNNYPGLAVSMMTRSWMSSQQILRIVYGLKMIALPDVDLVVSAGSKTLAANICMSRLLNAANIFYGSLRRFRAQDFTLVLTSYPRQTRLAPNIIHALKPSALDPDTLPSTNVNGRFGMVIGGPSRRINFSQNDWRILGNMMQNTHMLCGVRWSVSNSRRTPKEVNAMLSALSKKKHSPIDEFIDVTSTRQKTLSDLFAKVSSVVCTADSSSMISEAVWARKRVIAIEPNKFALTRNERNYRDWLESKGWIISYKLKEIEPEKLIWLFNALKPMSHNPLYNLSKLLAEKIVCFDK